MKLTIALLLALALNAAAFGVAADVVVLQVDGEGACLGRPLRPLMVLDEMEAAQCAGKAAFTALRPDGSMVKASPDKPYEASEKPGKPTSWWGNLRKTLQEFAQFDTHSEAVVALVTRGKVEPSRLLATSGDNNYLLPGAAELTFAWTETVPPYALTLVDAAGHALIQAQTSQTTLTAPVGKLEPGEYLVRIRSSLQEVEYPLTVVGPAQLPLAAKSILQADRLPQDAKDSLMAVALAEDPQWRFAALQLAAKLKDDRFADYLKSLRPGE